MRQGQKPFVIVTCIAIVIVALASVAPTFYRIATDAGIKVEPLSISSPEQPTTDLNGDWEIVYGTGVNSTQVGFTFNEVLPGKRKSTSGSTHQVTGSADISNDMLVKARIDVDTTRIRTDIERRDINVRNRILHTEQYPTASFVLSSPVNLTSLAEGNSPETITVPGTLTLHGTSRPVEATFEVYRTGKRLLMYGQLPVNRLDYNVKSPEFVAALIAEEGTLDIRLVFEKIDA